MGIADIRNKARTALHQAMQEPALYIVGSDDPVPVTVRVHREFNALGGVRGTSFAYAERQEVSPRIVFLRSEVALPATNAIVSVAPGEAYQVDNTLPPDGLTVTAEVVRMSAAKTAGLPVPE